mmetsp:Transcript_36614/g.116551  ORF Transcript_36614/g.116551 Transcript_36614/m.116551 type:complete len:280 (+) Transcript_36614:1075-1914(+)
MGASGWEHEASFRDKLAKLSQSQESIQTLSRWVQFHKAHAAEVAAVWAAEALGTGDEDRRLLYIYLANDVIQNSRRKGTPCADAFAGVLSRVLPLAHKAATPAVQTKIDRLLTIWEERLVLTSETIAALRREIVSGGVGPRDASAGASSAGDAPPTKRARAASGGEGGSGVPAPFLTLSEALDRLRDCSLPDKLSADRERSLDVLAIERGESTEREVHKALGLLAAQRVTLTHELGARRALVLTLSAAVEAQAQLCTRLESDLDECRALEERVEAWRHA